MKKISRIGQNGNLKIKRSQGHNLFHGLRFFLNERSIWIRDCFKPFKWSADHDHRSLNSWSYLSLTGCIRRWFFTTKKNWVRKACRNCFVLLSRSPSYFFQTWERKNQSRKEIKSFTDYVWAFPCEQVGKHIYV